MSQKEYYEKEADEERHLYFGKYVFSEESKKTSFPHFHDSLEFIFVREGAYWVHAGTQQRQLFARQCAFIDSFVPHYYRQVGKATVYAVVMDKKLFSNGTFTGYFPDLFPAIQEEDFSVFMRFFDWAEPFILQNEETKTGFANMLAGLLLSFCPLHEKKEDRTARAFAEVLKYLNAHFKENITLSSLAARFSYTKTYFSSLFNRFTGMPLRAYINSRRIGEVMRLKAQDPARSLFSLATECGYENEKTFYRAYAKYHKK